MIPMALPWAHGCGPFGVDRVWPRIVWRPGDWTRESPVRLVVAWPLSASLRRVGQIELPVEEVRGLVQDLSAVLCVRHVSGALPRGEERVETRGEGLIPRVDGKLIRHRGVGRAVEEQARCVTRIDIAAGEQGGAGQRHR